MRVAKQTGGVTTLYRHDGQMGVEDVETGSSGTSVTRYGLGARGVDMIERQTLPPGGGQGGGTTVTAFPIYDAHGNDVASLTRNGTGFSIGDRRTYDAWGVVRAQQSGGDPKLRYCANLGHKADDESGLVYMRARYYEPTSGRFVSEDRSKDGLNWFTYADNDPINRSDSNGKSSIASQFGALLIFIGLVMVAAACGPTPGIANEEILTGIGAVKIAIGGFFKAIDLMRTVNPGEPLSWAVQMAAKQTMDWMTSPTVAAALSSLAGRAVLATLGTAMTCLGVWVMMEDD